MQTQTVQKFDGKDLNAAHQLALAECEPVFFPVDVYADDRGWSIMNQFQAVLSPQGQINISTTYPNVTKAWHRHQKQTDFWLCAAGNIKVGVHREKDGNSWMTYIGEKSPGIVIIPPLLWHGMATVSHEQAMLIYYVTHAYDPKNPDEERRAYDSVPGFPWDVRFH